MFDENKVVIAPDLKVKDLLLKGWELDQIIEHAIEKGYLKEDIVYEADAFKPQFIEMLRNDKAVLEKLNSEWNAETSDPKFDLFKEKLQGEFFDTNNNKTGKLVLFSESVDTLSYLCDRIKKELQREDVLLVTSQNRNRLGNIIKENFDAN